MSFDPVAKLSDVLAGGYHRSARLLALLDHPLDSRSQEEAMVLSQEILRVFMVSMSMLTPDDSKRTLTMMAPVPGADGSFDFCSTPVKDKVVSRGGVTTSSHKSIRAEEVTRKEVTSSPYDDGYQWQKYGQKNIQNCSFMRFYFKCHDRRCQAKKKVQQQDAGTSSSSEEGVPVFEVTYVNEHTCRLATASDVPGKSLPVTTTTMTGRPPHSSAAACTSRNGDAAFDLLTQRTGGAGREEEAIVSCLAAVIRGTPPGAEPSAPQVRTAGRQQAPMRADDGGSLADGGGETATMVDTGFSWDPSSSSPSVWPTEAADDVMDLCDDVHRHVDAARFADTVWPRSYYT